MKTLRVLLTILLVLLVHCSKAQRLSNPKTIKVKGDYTHAATSTVFPVSIDGYERSEVTAFDQQHTNIGAKYQQKSRNGKTTVSVYVYPADVVSNYRFSSQYWASAQSIAMAADRGLEAVQTYRSVEKDGYKIHGFNAIVPTRQESTALELYECGDWFFKIRTTSTELDSTGIYALNKKVVSSFDLVNLVKRSAPVPQYKISVSTSALADSLMLGCTLARALGELDWALKNVDSLERLAGFPSIYIELHVAALKSAIEFADTNKYTNVNHETQAFVSQLRAIAANGYLGQFVLEQYDMLLISKDPDKTYDFKAYYEWKRRKGINITLNERLYAISNEAENGKKAKRRR